MRRQARVSLGTLSLSLPFLCFTLKFTAATKTNRTIDDTYGDSVTGKAPSFMPFNGGVWADQTCEGCAIKADASKAFDGTYKAATYAPALQNVSISMDFEGTAIHVFFILANNQGTGITSLTMVNFTLDGQYAGSFTHQPDMTTKEFQYNSSVFSKTGLSNKVHQLVISTTGLDFNTFTSFDYAIYTYDDGVSSSSSSSTSTSNASPTRYTSDSDSANSNPVSIPVIVGSVVGGVVLIGVLVGVLLFCRRRRRLRSSRKTVILGDDLSPPMSQPGYSTTVGQPVAVSATNVTTPFLAGAPYSNDQYHDGDSPFRPDVASDSTQFSSSNFRTHAMIVANPDPYANPADFDTYEGHLPSNRSDAASTHYCDNSNGPQGQVMLSAGGYETLAAPISASAAAVFSAYSEQSMYTSNPDYGVYSIASTPQKPLSKLQLEMRRARQNELDQRLRAVKQDMQDLSSDLQAGVARSKSKVVALEAGDGNGRPKARTEEEDTEMREMREQMKQMQEQIQFLQTQQRSEWAQGLSDEPPPGYNA